MRKIATSIFLIFSLGVCSQESNSSVKLGMKAHFSAPAISAYQENSRLKVVDFFQYLEVLSDENTSEKLQSEVERNVHNLFHEKDVLVSDLFSNSGERITVSELMTQIRKKNIKFLVTGFETNPNIQSDYWFQSYNVEFTQQSTVKSRKLNQKIFFSPQVKKFGNNQKTVWVTQLGEFEFATF